MIFRQLFDHSSYTFSYLLAASDHRAIIIDPVQEKVPLYLQLIEALGLQLIFSVDTHVHADHITGAGLLQQQTGCTLLISDKSPVSCAHVAIFSEEKPIVCGDVLLQPIYTPGHTDDSFCFLLGERVFTGDTLLIRGTGRTDFQNGDAAMQYDSIFQKLLTLPEETLVFPGHDYNGMQCSTIGEERLHNPRLQVTSKQAYVDLMASLDLPQPHLMDVALPLNLKCGRN